MVQEIEKDTDQLRHALRHIRHPHGAIINVPTPSLGPNLDGVDVKKGEGGGVRYYGGVSGTGNQAS